MAIPAAIRPRRDATGRGWELGLRYGAAVPHECHQPRQGSAARQWRSSALICQATAPDAPGLALMVSGSSAGADGIRYVTGLPSQS